MRVAPSKIAQGFTLIELIAVLVILGIVASIGTTFLVTTLDMYNSTSERVALIQRGRVTIEQMTRYLRDAVPNSVRVSSTGKCVEFLPAVSGGNYIATLPDSANGAAAINSTTTGAFYITSGSARYFLVGGLSSSDIYTSATPSARVAIASLTGTPYTGVTFSASRTFLRNSVNKRFYIADYPMRFCLAGTQLLRYSNYGFSTASLGDSDPGGSADVMADAINVTSSSFALSAGSEDRNTSVAMTLALTKGTTRITLNHKVLVRNVP